MKKPVKCGIDVLREDRFRLLAGSNVGLITNHTGRDSRGEATVDLLNEAPNLKLKSLFGPEHGIRGDLDSAIHDGVNPRTRLPVFSLYGDNHAPSEQQLAGLDTLVYDVQDVGARFYTYISTLGLCLETAATHGLRFVVLDRPNPIGGVKIEGPIADADALSFVAHHTIPVRHGLTVGEMATLLNLEKSLNADLHVVRASGWRRADLWDDTGLVWINPSPNMRSLTQAILYPGICLLETTNISVGRGTDTPFEHFGAPWLNSVALSAALNSDAPPGARFVPVEFIPASSSYAGLLCHGVNVIVTDRARYRSVLTGAVIIEYLRRLHRDEWQAEGINRLLVHKVSMQRLLAGESAHSLSRSWAHDCESFEARRRPALMYN